MRRKGKEAKGQRMQVHREKLTVLQVRLFGIGMKTDAYISLKHGPLQSARGPLVFHIGRGKRR